MISQIRNSMVSDDYGKNGMLRDTGHCLLRSHC